MLLILGKVYLSISITDDLGHCIRVKHGVLKILHGAWIVDKRSKMYVLYIL